MVVIPVSKCCKEFLMTNRHLFQFLMSYIFTSACQQKNTGHSNEHSSSDQPLWSQCTLFLVMWIEPRTFGLRSEFKWKRGHTGSGTKERCQDTDLYKSLYENTYS